MVYTLGIFITFFYRKLKLYEEQELTMQVFCDLENKEMPVSQDNMVVNVQFMFYFIILHYYVGYIVSIININVCFREIIPMQQYDVHLAAVLSTLY